MEQAAHINGKVEYREGEGPNIAIRPGPVTVVTSITDATLSWTDGETHGPRPCRWATTTSASPTAASRWMPDDPARAHQRGGRLSMKACTPSSALPSIMLPAIVCAASSYAACTPTSSWR